MNKRRFDENKNLNDWAIENEWRWECHQMRLGVGKLSVPWPMMFLLFGSLIATFFVYVIALLLALDTLERFTKVKLTDLSRVLRSQRSFWLTPKVMAYHVKLRMGKECDSADRPDYINQMGILHGQPKWKKRSNFMTPIIAFAFSCTLTYPETAEAQARLILPKTEDQKVETEHNLEAVPMLNREHIVSGYGIDVNLSQVMQQVTPKTWDVRFRDAELANMPISWRSQDNNIIELFYDLAERYNILFRYSNRSGIILIEWANDSCNSRMDKANVYQIVC